MSENKKKKNSPRPSSSRFKLKVSKSSKTEEESINNGQVTPNRHSTPIRKANIMDNMEDSPEMDYRCSPIMGLPSTQQSEVMWSWDNSPQEETKISDNIRTPKRSAQLQKRRIADSPLMYAPLKVKLKKQERDVDLFLANFERFNNQMSVQEDVPVASTSGNLQSELKTRLNSDKNLETSDESDMKLVYPDDETAMETVFDKQNSTILNDFFDDEIDESMVRCSQQVEEEFLSQIVQQEIQEKTSSISPENKEKQESNNKNQVNKITGLQNLIKIPFEKPKEKKVTIIPDDSFDEYLSQFADDDFNFSSRISENPCNLSRNSKKSLFPSNNNGTSIKMGLTKSCSTLETKKLVSGNERLLQKTKSFDEQRESCRFLSTTVAKELVKKNEQKPQSLSSPGKFFKSKSHSEPFSKDPNTSRIQNKNSVIETSTSNSNTQNVRKVYGKSFTCKIFSDSSLNRSTGSGNDKIKGSSQDSFISNDVKCDNVPLSNLNRSMEVQEQPKNNSQATFSAEEIERKRIEAKMKLEAKRKMLLGSKVQNTKKILPIAQSIKR